MTQSRAHVSSTDDPPEAERDTIPAPPPSAASLAGLGVHDEDHPVESRVESRRRDTVPAPAGAPSAEGMFEEEPATDRAPVPSDRSMGAV